MNDVMYKRPHLLIEMPEKADCRFAGSWLLKAAEAQNYWSEVLRDPAYNDTASALCWWCEPSFEAAALESLTVLRQADPPFHPITSKHIVTVDTELSESGVFTIEFCMMVELAFFTPTGDAYQMTMSLELMQRAALKVASTRAEGEIEPVRLLHTLPQVEAEAARCTRLGLRSAGFKIFYAPLCPARGPPRVGRPAGRTCALGLPSASLCPRVAINRHHNLGNDNDCNLDCGAQSSG